MDHIGPDPENGTSPSQGARMEDDFVRALTPTKGTRHRRLSASLPLAIVSILVVATVAFGATVVRPMVIGPGPTETPVAGVGGDQPDDTPTPTVEPTTEPTANPTTAPVSAPTPAPTVAPTTEPTTEPTPTPVPNDLKLTAKLEGTKVVLSWTAYQGPDFAYYKVVRSGDKTAGWPLGDGDTLVAAVSDQSKLTFTDCPAAGKAWSYRVFAVNSAQAGYAVLDFTNLATVEVPAPPTATPPPVTSGATDLGPLNVVKNSNGTYTFSWSAYTGDVDFSYYKLDGQPFPAVPGYVENGGHYWACVGTSDTSVTIKVDPGTWNVNVEAVYFPNGGSAAAARTQTLKLEVAPTVIPSIGLTVTVGDDGLAHLNWDKYAGDHFQEYLVARTENGTPTQSNVVKEITDVNVTTWVDKSVKPGHTYNYRIMAWTSETFCNGGTILAESPVQTITIPAPATPAPTAPAPTAPPAGS